MYYCHDCGAEFEHADIYKETHGFSYPPFEERQRCPFCGGESIGEKSAKYCRYCGARLTVGVEEYCDNACRKKGEAMWSAERKKRGLAYTDPLNIIIREADEYNRIHGTTYSYGQYTALIMPTLDEKEK